jgi:hypothetical protein
LSHVHICKAMLSRTIKSMIIGLHVDCPSPPLHLLDGQKERGNATVIGSSSVKCRRHILPRSIITYTKIRSFDIYYILHVVFSLISKFSLLVYDTRILRSLLAPPGAAMQGPVVVRRRRDDGNGHPSWDRPKTPIFRGGLLLPGRYLLISSLEVWQKATSAMEEVLCPDVGCRVHVHIYLSKPAARHPRALRELG